MNKELIAKSIVFIISGVFIGASILPNTNGTIDFTPADTFVTNLPTAEWWLMFHHDLNHTGYSTSIAPETNTLLWEYTTDDSVFSSPSVANGKIYVGSWDNNVYCLNADNGVKIWEYTTGNAVISSPAISNGKIYVGSGDGKLYCLNADTGAKIWEYITSNPISSSPAVAYNRLYVGSADGNVYCLNADTGIKIWQYTTGNDVYSSPAISNGKLYVGSWDTKVYCLNADTGVKIWEYATGDMVYSSPLISNGKVYVGSHDNTLYCLNADTGTWIWDYTTADNVYSSPAIINSKIYIGSGDGKLYCLNADTGAWIWEYTTGDNVDSSPAIANGKIYIGSWDQKLYCLNADTGSKIWEYTTGSSIYSSAAVANSKVYVASNDNKVYCFYNGIVRPTVTTNAATALGDTTATLNGNLDNMGKATSCTVQFQYGLTTSYGSFTSLVTMTCIGSFNTNISGLTPGTIYHFRAIADNIAGMTYGGDMQFTTTGGAENHPPNKPTITGETNGDVHTSYDYTIQTIDPDQDNVQYFIDWGDTTNSGWLGPYNSGQTVSVSHNWDSEGTYAVKVKAKDTPGRESDWATLTVTMPMVTNQEFVLTSFIFVFGGSVKVKVIHLEPGENYIDLEVLDKPLYIWENEKITIHPGAFVRLFETKGLFLPSCPLCIGICNDYGIIG